MVQLDRPIRPYGSR
ncbi:hypothetical protein OIU79_003028 [Salix purpurea]|uniref:Uncharacterized protein n=1 Tax=Salix purpurea TaxID=77065 RepID=A0A9Q0ZEQ8_SALPP|nr:hypothetical protein OIU79_003028 [Salix purpurea]